MGNQLLLYGKKTTDLEVAKEIVRLLLGDKDRRIEPKTIKEIMLTLGINSRQTFYNYKKIAIQQGLLSEDGSDIPQKSTEEEFKRFDELHKITEDPLVAEWKKDLTTRKGGSQVETWKERIRSLEIVCNSLRITPRALILSRKDTESHMKDFIELYREGNTDQRKKRNRNQERLFVELDNICKQNGFSIKIKDSIVQRINEEEERRKDERIRSKAYKTAQGVRDFCGFFGIIWKRGTGGVMSQKVVGHAKYSDIKLTPEELKKVDLYINQKYGIHSDIYRWFWIGLESCARFNALYGMNLDYTKHVKDGITVYLMKAYESKTKQLKGGMWTKYITKSTTQESIDSLKQKGIIKIYDTSEKTSVSKFKKVMRYKMIEIFLHLGITQPYFYEHTNHVLRHIGAHYWLEILNYDYARVAKIGGWHTVDELIKSYGEMPPEKLLEGIDTSLHKQMITI